MDGGRQGEGVRKVKISGCDKEHEVHEMLVDHFKVRMILFLQFCQAQFFKQND